LLAYSDGLTEAENPQGEMLGEDGVKKVMMAHAAAGSQQLEARLLETIQEFTAGRSLSDDITLILVERV
jgi:serine phosphatase RsbU (regulator of sigma subunit)